MSNTTKWYLNSAISIALMIFIRFIPAPEPLTQQGMTVLGLFIGAIYGWCTVELIWPSLLALVLLGFTGLTTPTAAWSQLISNGTVGMCLWLMIAVGILSTSNLTQWVARWSVSRSWTKGKPWMLFHTVIIATMMCASVVGGIATIILFITLAISICEEVGYKKGDVMAAFFVFAVGFYATIGNMLFPFHTAIIANFGFMAAGSGGVYDGSFNYLSYMIFSFITIFTVYFVTYLFFRYVIKPDTSLLENYDPGSKTLEKMNANQKTSIVLFAILFVIYMGSSVFPKGSLLNTICGSLGIVGGTILVTAVACIIRINGERFTTFPDLVTKNVMWPVILMFGTAVVLASFLNSPACGLQLWIKEMIGPFFAGMNKWVFLITFMGITLFFTNLINNTVVAAIMLPISFGLCLDLGMSPIAFTACFIMFVDYAFLLPSSSPCGALMHSYGEWLPKKYLYSYGMMALAITFVITIIVGWPIASMVLPYTV